MQKCLNVQSLHDDSARVYLPCIRNLKFGNPRTAQDVALQGKIFLEPKIWLGARLILKSAEEQEGSYLA